MNEDKTHTRTGTGDRKLGDEWLDWDGGTDHGEKGVDERINTFLILAASALFVFIVFLALGWYLAKPRFDQASPLLAYLVGSFLLTLIAAFLLIAIIEAALLLQFKRSFIPYGIEEKLLLTLLPKSIWLGTKLGVHRDRIGSSFIKAHNLLLKSHAREVKTDALLILLPRCLKKEARQQVAARVNGRAAQIVTVAGGEEARKAIRQYRPSLILAVACERDLLSGIKDVAEKIHVLAIPNERPEGPCKNTHLRLDTLDEAFSFIAAREKGPGRV
ncbi:MAG TPA: DUF116 domain-containing protein [Syntrophorhabdaceae bacterium]|jgi:hypothetical protein